MKEAIFIQGKALGNFRIVCTVKNINKRVSKTTVNKVSNISVPKKNKRRHEGALGCFDPPLKTQNWASPPKRSAHPSRVCRKCRVVFFIYCPLKHYESWQPQDFLIIQFKSITKSQKNQKSMQVQGFEPSVKVFEKIPQ